MPDKIYQHDHHNGIPDGWMLQRLYATLFFLIYLAAVMGNLLIIIASTIDQHLQIPMYFFLNISATVPKSIMDSLMNSHSTSFLGSAMQVFLVFYSGTDFALLMVMTYDHYAAICHPPHYEGVMHRGACMQMATASWLSGCFYASIHVAGTLSVSFCGSNLVHKFFCDIKSLLTLSCFGEHILEDAFVILSGCFVFVCFILMVVSCTHIFATVLRIPSVKGRQKSFSTCLPLPLRCCDSVPVFWVFNIFGKKIEIFTEIVAICALHSITPTLNPLNYGLRNKDMQTALGKVIVIKFAK